MSTTDFDMQMMRRCIKIASFGGRSVKSNPQVGAVITYQNRIIGEGWHQNYGGPHAERAALANVKKIDRQYLNQSHLYVSLEPCNHYGKTPPCVGAILEVQIPNVSIAILDPTPKMSGKSVETLRSKGVQVNIHAITEEAKRLIAPFYAQHIKKRPFILLKYATSKDGYMGKINKQVWLSNTISKLSVHLSRSLVDGILIGTNTVIVDNPQLTTRLVEGSNPLRIILDQHERIPKNVRLLSDDHPTLIITSARDYVADGNKEVLVVEADNFQLPRILQLLLEKGIYTLMVEGGKNILSSFINGNLWDECHLYKTPKLLSSGIKAPQIKGKLFMKTQLANNRLLIINNL
ncbi:MAG: diaminohydroxyphosphoribosylaminopyrimidine deaminase [Saprospiraceae bacterium]|jgi:diaminohydroxyphosphoribosylaminopyrimidine deaminase/5-amino-6-(5-phosphoribosylamino)uracil reductase